MLLTIAVIATVLAAGSLLWLPRVRRSQVWLATVTPLASIIGSGFLVLGPMLEVSYGKYAPAIMAALCLGAYLFGAAIRYNIARIDAEGIWEHRWTARAETLASWALGFAYIISVAYYLNLFGAFAVSLTAFDDPVSGRVVTTAIFGVILAVGWIRGFKSLEHMEYVSVTVKLAIIAGLLLGLAAYFWGHLADGGLHFNAPRETGWAGITIAFGLIVTVQGFETSRYLGDDYDARTRIRSMRWSQWTATVIYMAYIVLFAYAFDGASVKLTETAIVGMMAVVLPILPVLLVAAALAAQFSAAVADTSGSGGLAEELTGGRISARMGYAILVGIGVAITWVSSVFEIISYASRAFALYYALQAGIAAAAAWRAGHQARSAAFAALAAAGTAILIFGQPAEG